MPPVSQTFNALHLHDPARVRALAWPYRFRAVLIFEEPADYFAAIQIVTDVVNGRDGNAFDQQFDDASSRATTLPVLLANPGATTTSTTTMSDASQI